MLLFTWNDALGIKKAFYSILLSLDGVIYNLICWLYDLFMFLARMDIFKNADYENIVRRIYIILGVVMLFVLTYSLLKAVINPDDFSKGENSFANIIKNVLISLVIITLLPTVFDIAFQVQNVILRSNVIGKLILSEDYTTSAINGGGRTMAVSIFQAFFRYNEETKTSEDYGEEADSIKSDLAVTFNQVERGLTFQVFNGKYTVANGSGEERNFPELVVDNVIDYTFIISSAAGVFVLWCLLLFCFDLGIRVVKLAFYQVIAPIAVVCRVLPNKKAKDIFGNWMRLTVATFMEVFIRIFIMYIGVYFIVLVADRGPDILAYALESGLRPLHALFAEAFVIMGIIAFIRQAPKLLQDIFGFDTGGMKLGFKGLTERLGEGGGYAIGGAAVAGIGGLGQSLRRNIGNVKRAKGFWGKAGAIGRTLGGIPGGFAGAGGRAFFNNWNAKNMQDARSGVNKGVSDMLESMSKKENYRANVNAPWLAGTTRGRIKSGLKSVGNFVGLGGDFERLQKQQKLYSEANALSALKDIVADDASVMAAAKEKEETAKRDLSQYVADLTAGHYQVINRNGQNYVAQIRNGAAHIVADSNGNTYGSLEALARERRIEDVERADTVLKATQQLAIKAKYDKGDGRVLAALNKTNRLISENRGDPDMDALGQVGVITDAQEASLRAALNSDNARTIKSALDSLEATQGTLLNADKAMKAAGGRVSEQLANLREKQNSSK